MHIKLYTTALLFSVLLMASCSHSESQKTELQTQTQTTSIDTVLSSPSDSATLTQSNATTIQVITNSNSI